VTCEEFQELAGAYGLGALDPDERAACEGHLAERTHRGCEVALGRALATVGALGTALPPVPPSEGVWRAIEARLGSAGPPTEERPPPRRVAWAGWASAAAAALFLALWLGERREAQRGREVAQRAAQAEAQARSALEGELRSLRTAAEAQQEVAALLEMPGSRVIPLEPAPGRAGRAAAVVNLAARRAVIVSTSLPPAAGKTYQLWVIRGTGAPSPAGFLQPTGGLLLGQIDPALLAVPPDALAVSLEPTGGSPAPTDVQLVGKLAG